MFHRKVTANTSSIEDNSLCSNGRHHCTTVSIQRQRQKQKKKFSMRFWGMQYLVEEDQYVILLLIQLVVIGVLIGSGLTFLLRQSSSTSLLDSISETSEGGQQKQKHDDLLAQHHDNNYPIIPPSHLYTIPDSMPQFGDKSDEYALLRKEMDVKQDDLPPIEHEYTFHPHPMEDSNSGSDHQVSSYDIHNCPETPPPGYPYAWNLMQILQEWPANDPAPPPNHKIYQGLCVFDYTTDIDKALTYRKAEVPFVVQNDPRILQAAQRWNYPRYLEKLLGNVKYKTEYSENNHFMYWQPKLPTPTDSVNDNSVSDNTKDWKPPTTMTRMTYHDWLSHANVTDDILLGPDQPHWYFRLTGKGLNPDQARWHFRLNGEGDGPRGQSMKKKKGNSEFLFDELPFFQPRKDSLYLVEPEKQQGINCRFGMKGVIAENHFDLGRNAIAVLGGQRRYILSHPDQCDYLSLYPQDHPSARHSAVDWTNPDLEKFPEFAMAQANEVVLQAGDVLYLPSNWFHFIVSLSLNFQCNIRSGVSQDYMAPIHACGFIPDIS